MHLPVRLPHPGALKPISVGRRRTLHGLTCCAGRVGLQGVWAAALRAFALMFYRLPTEIVHCPCFAS